MGKSMKLVLLFFSFFFFNSVSSQEKFSLNGTVSDISTNETLIGVTVIVDTIGAFVVFVAVKVEILPDPFATKPIALLLFVQK